MFDVSDAARLRQRSRVAGGMLLLFMLFSFSACGDGKSDSSLPKNLEMKQDKAPGIARINPTPKDPGPNEHAPQDSTTLVTDDWPQFRGPGFRSTTDQSFPLEWDIDQGVFWKSGLPGRGASSPIVSGDRIYLTAFDGFGLTVNETGDYRKLRHHLLCFEKKSGKPVWQREITGTSLLQKMNPELVRHGFASSTPVTDGDKIFAFFGVTGVFAFDRDGNLLWQRNTGLNTHYFGSSSSPILHDQLLIVNASLESDTIYALDKNTGARSLENSGNQ